MGFWDGTQAARLSLTVVLAQPSHWPRGQGFNSPQVEGPKVLDWKQPLDLKAPLGHSNLPSSHPLQSQLDDTLPRD